MMEELYKIPSSWTWSTIEVVGKTYSGGTPKASDESNFDGDIPWITPADLTGYKAQYISQGRRNLSTKGLNSCSAKLMPKDTVLFSSRAPIGYVAIASNPVSTNQGFKSISPHQGIDSRYVYFYLKSAKDLAKSRASGTTFKELSGSRFNQLPIPIAPSSEQVRIVDRIEQLFSDLDEGEVLLKTVQKQLATYRLSVLKAAVTGELTKDWREKNKKKLESGEKLLARILESRRKNWRGRGKYEEPLEAEKTEDFSIPNGWAVASFDALITSSQNGMSKRRGDEGKSVDVLRLADIEGYKIKADDLRQIVCTDEEIGRWGLIDNDIICIRVNGSKELVGKFILYTLTKEPQLYCDHFIRFRTSSEALSRYLCLFSMSRPARSFIESRMVSTAGQNTISQGSILQMAVLLPSEDEQLAILDRVDDVFSQISALESWCEAELKRSATLRQSILKSAFSGKLVVQDPADEPARELLARIKLGKKNETKSKVRATGSRRGRKTRAEKTGAA